MTSLHTLDLIAIGLDFVVLIGIGLRVARKEHGSGESESFLAADRNMNLVQTTASMAPTDLGGGFAALASVAFDEPFSVSAFYLGWIVSLPLLVSVSLLTEHSPEEDLDMF